MPQAADRNPTVRIRVKTGWLPINLREIWEFRDVLVMLAIRDIKLRYKQTAFGIVWVVMQPLLAAFIMSLVFGQFARLPSGGQPYLLFVFAGLLSWNLFASVLQRAGNSLVSEAKLITKVYFPRLLIPMSGVVSAFIDFLVSLIFMLILMVALGVWPSWWIAILPIVTATNLILAAGISFWLSALNVRYRDFMYALPFLIQVWMYASPVVYGMALVTPSWRPFFILNPMTGVIEGFRQALLGSSSISALAFMVSVVWALLTLITGAYFFKRVEREFADRL